MKKKDVEEEERREPGLGPGSAGQSGDIQGLEAGEAADLLEEGQSFEAGVMEGIGDADTADDGGIRTREVPEDDVPSEYLDDEQGNNA